MQANQCAVANSSLKSSSGANKHSKANAMLLAMLYPLRVLSIVQIKICIATCTYLTPLVTNEQIWLITLV